MRTILVLLCTLVLTRAAAPPAADAQGILRRIKQNAKERVESRKAQTTETIVQNTSAVVDSAVRPLGEAVDSVVSRTAAAADSVVRKTNQAIARALQGDDAESKRLRSLLEEGRAVLPEIAFEVGADGFAPNAEALLSRLAEAIEEVPGRFLIEGHMEPGGDPAAAQRVSEARAAAVKAWLIDAGVPESRVFAVGRGVTPPPAGVSSAARIEVIRVR
jgi:outer membrane protein OmpA-like peptidoglycan-associated protein